ncbi:hypothetical protein KOR42_32830 [Thalassoglobus neptunius]|uniref:Uncharacterized protein n=1 Tax=Thalassoglobus neptunius TaxID=1938619 RepID=A0A5C5WMH1_9PLAN|nr:hypothetical protein KOR42_32830 [Thalassoglobus neptunius]
MNELTEYLILFAVWIGVPVLMTQILILLIVEYLAIHT